MYRQENRATSFFNAEIFSGSFAFGFAVFKVEESFSLSDHE